MRNVVEKLGLWLVAMALGSVPAFASGLVYTCDASVTAVSSTLCTTLNTDTAGQYATIFSNANALIYVQFAATDDVASNEQFYNTVAYTSYYNALSSHKSGTPDSTAVASLPSGSNPVVNGYGVALTSALAQALGLSGGIGITSTGSSCTLGNSGCYNDVITVSNTANFYYDTGTYVSGEFDFFTSVEHETNEAFGTASCIANTTGQPAVGAGCDNFTPGVSAADLFRYSASGTRSYLGTNGDQAEGSLAYFSINSGATNVVPYNNTNNGADYGDFSTLCTYVQDTFGCNSKGGMNIANDGGVEIAMLDAVGYNLTTTGKTLSATGTGTPEPATFVTLGTGVGAVWFMARRRRKTASASGGSTEI